MKIFDCLLMVIAMSFFSTSAPGKPVPTKEDEVVHLFPAYGVLNESGQWQLAVRGWVFEPERDSVIQSIAVKALAKPLDIDDTHPGWSLFDRRVRWFLVDNERGKRIGVQCDGAMGVGKSAPNGHFTAHLTVKSEGAPRTAGAPSRRLMVSTPSVDARVAQSEAFLVPPEGLSIISDIDDTVKVTNVLDRAELIQNTFTRPFAAIPGMAALYTQWAQQGAMLHFLSSSPWQLQPLLASFLSESGFPPATFHLKSVRLKDRSLFNLFRSSTETKPPQIKAILRDFPKRKFILVGDSGEHDPEVYAEIAQQHPEQIQHIYIRRVPNDARPAERFDEAFKGLPRSLWTVFDDAHALKAHEAPVDIKPQGP